jgi:hypothetical protein
MSPIRFQIAVAALTLVQPSRMIAGEPQDINVCDALAQLNQLRNKTVHLVGTLQGTFYHGFGLFGRADLQSCSPPSVKWLPSPQSLGVIEVQPISKDQTIPKDLTLFEQAIASPGILVRAEGVLRTPWLLLTLCFEEDKCFGNGYYHGRCPASLELQSIQVLDSKLVHK